MMVTNFDDKKYVSLTPAFFSRDKMFPCSTIKLMMSPTSLWATVVADHRYNSIRQICHRYFNEPCLRYSTSAIGDRGKLAGDG